MPSTYTTNNGIELIGSGEQSGTWDVTTNLNFDIIDQALDGQVTVTLGAAGSSGAPNTLAITDGALSNGRNRYIAFTDGGDLGATAYVQLTPNDSEKIITIRNNLSGSRSIIFFQGTYNASNDYELTAGKTAMVRFDGAGTGAVVSQILVATDPAAIAITGGTITGATIDNAVIGGSTPAAGTFTTGTITTADINGGAIDGTTVGSTTPAAGAFTTLSATGNFTFAGTAFTGVSGADTTLMTGTSGPNGEITKFNADGDIITTGFTPSGTGGDIIPTAASGGLTSGTLASWTGTFGLDGTIDVLDEDDMASDSATDVASQQSIKAYVDAVGTTTQTHTATATPSTSGTLSLSPNTLTYIRIGDLCYITGQLFVSSRSSPVGNQVYISLPVVPKTGLTQFATTNWYDVSGGTTDGRKPVAVDFGTTARAELAIDASTVTAGDRFHIGFTYITN